MIVKPIYQASFPHPWSSYCLKPYSSLQESALTIYLMSASLSQKTPFWSASWFGARALHPHSCLDCVLCSGWVIYDNENDGYFLSLSPVLYRFIVKSQDGLFQPTLQLHHFCQRKCHSPTGSLHGEPQLIWLLGMAAGAYRRTRSLNLPFSSFLRSGRLWDRDGLWFFSRNLLSSFRFPSLPIRSHSWKSNKFYLSVSQGNLFAWVRLGEGNLSFKPILRMISHRLQLRIVIINPGIAFARYQYYSKGFGI